MACEIRLCGWGVWAGGRMSYSPDTWPLVTKTSDGYRTWAMTGVVEFCQGLLKNSGLTRASG